MRVIGGADRGRVLRAPPGFQTRPTADRVREALFDILGPAARDMHALDLFAGSGAVGIEALSRGAARVVFVESSPAALRVLRANLASLGHGGPGTARARVVAGDVLAVLPRLPARESPVDLVFLDPPFDSNLAGRTLAALAGSALIAPATEIVVQHSARMPLLPLATFVEVRRARRFGESALTFLRAERYTPPA